MHGGRRVNAGRKPGSPNKASIARQEEITASGLTPLDYMLSVMRDKEVSRADRLEAAKAVAPYVHPKLAQVDNRHSGPGGGPIEAAVYHISDKPMTEEEWEKERVRDG